MGVFYQDKSMRAINISDGRTGAICPIESPLYQNLATYKLEFASEMVTFYYARPSASLNDITLRPVNID